MTYTPDKDPNQGLTAPTSNLIVIAIMILTVMIIVMMPIIVIIVIQRRRRDAAVKFLGAAAETGTQSRFWDSGFGSFPKYGEPNINPKAR